jgi:DNA repair exonuclease SbcCD ATPase subunit
MQGYQGPSAGRLPLLHNRGQNCLVLRRTASGVNKGGQVSDDITKAEPVSPVIGFVKRAGDTSGKTADHAAWVQDLQDRQARTAELTEKRRQSAKQEINVVAELDAELSALEAGAQDFEQSFGKPNTELIESKKIVAELTARLAEEQAKLDAIEARGDSVTRLFHSVTRAEGALNGLLRAAEEKAMRKLVTAKFGWEAPMHKVGRETLNELALNISVQSLRQFAIQLQRDKTSDVAVLQRRLEAIGNKLAALREHMLGERSVTLTEV